MYIVERLSLRQIGNRCGVSASTIRRCMKKYHIPARTKSEALSGDKNPMHGRTQSAEAREKISAGLRITNADPIVKAKRSAASSGANNNMFGRTHSDEVKQASKVRLQNTRVTPEFIEAHKKAMERPEVRSAISKSAQLRIGESNPFYGHQHSEKTKNVISAANKGRFVGAKGANWKGGKTSLAILIRNSEPAVRWRRAVLERDAFTCQGDGCGKIGGTLQADHIVPFAVLLDEYQIKTLEAACSCVALWDLSNGRTLCVPCHKKTPTYCQRVKKWRLEHGGVG